jgi:hypothetical protein
LKGQKRVLWLSLFGFNAWILYGLRPYALMSIILSWFMYFLFKKFGYWLFIIGVALVFVWYQFFNTITLPIIRLSLQGALQYRNYFISFNPGGSQMNHTLPVNNFILFVFNYGLSYLSNLVGPFIHQVNSLSTAGLMILESIPMLGVLIFIALKYKSLDEIDRFLLFHAFIWQALIALSNDNFGALTRLRTFSYLIFLVIFAKLSLEHKLFKKMRVDHA